MWRVHARVSEPAPIEPGIRGRSLFSEESGMRVECENSGAALLTFFVEALTEDTTSVVQRKHEAALRQERWLKYLS
jgi:hypothetical protein